MRIPPATDPINDPVASLKQYIQVTEPIRPESQAVFLSLTAPYKALSSATISNILNEAIKLAGLAGQGYTARSFRPTGATAAIEAGCMPETVMQIGRWKTKEVFFNRYVYPQAPKGYTDGVLQFRGIDGPKE